MLYVSHTPDSPPLAGAVEVMFLLHGYCPQHRVERLVPDGRIALVIELDDQPRHIVDNDTLEPIQECREAWLSGVHTGYITIATVPDTVLFGARISPGKAFPLVKRPVHELNDRVVRAADVFGPGIRSLRDALRDALRARADPRDVLRIAERWLCAQFDPERAPHPEIDEAVARIMANPMVATLEQLSSRSTFSNKHFIHLFKRYVGPTPKHFQRIVRFAQVLPLIHEQETVNWAQLSAECGYFDQSHFIKDFYRFSGYRPQAFLDERHDRLNFFPDTR